MSEKILIVDDELSIQKLLGKYLGNAGYECHVANDVESAKEALAVRAFDLLLCDLNMPGSSGLVLIRYAKEHYPRMGRVMVTGFGSPEIANKIMDVGVYGYIIKPLIRNVVLVTVANALRHLRLDLHMQACKIEMQKDISDQTKKMTAIMSNINVGVVMFDRDMKIMELNRKMQLWFPGISQGTVLHCSHVLRYPAREGICEDCPMAETFKTLKSCEATHTVLTGQGEREFRMLTNPIFDNTGNVYAGIALYEDVTEKILLEKDLRQAQKFEAVGQLAAGIAHEINSPMQYVWDNLTFLKDSFDNMAMIINTYEELWQELTRKGSVPAELGQKISDAQQEADVEFLLEEVPKTFDQSFEGVRRVEKIVRAMKDFSHPGSDEKKANDINKILESTITVCKNEWKYVAEVVTDLAHDLPMVPCFAGELSQVFLNIIVNGAHAIGDVTEGGSKGKGEISIRTAAADNRVQIRIRDTGGGIPKEIQDRVFERFFTTKAQGKGTGQGLAIARQVIVDQHQGMISFESEAGKGTTFVIEIPITSDE